MSALAVLLAVAIAALVAWRARAVMRAERGQRGRGCAPGQGLSTIRAEYSSGVGGGESTQYTVPKDPLAYARLFVPNTKPKG